MPLDLLAASALGELSGADEARVEEHVVSCSDCAARFEAFVRLGPAIAALVRAHPAVFIATPSVVEKLEAERLVSRRYVLAPGGRVPCTVSPADIYTLTRLDAELAGASRVDLRSTLGIVEDIPFDPRTGSVYLVNRSATLLPLPTRDIDLRLVAVEADGSERTLGEYTLAHTAYAPPA